MKIAIVGPGAIGSTFAWHLARAGHAVTVVARGKRLEALQRDQAIVRADGERTPVAVAEQLDPSIAYDLVLVTVLATQVAAVLPALKASVAKRLMFMFNTFDAIAPLRDAVGAARFAFGFPAGVLSHLIDGRIHPQVRAGTTADDAALAKTFTEAGIPTVVEPDMQSWLRTHAALVVPLMSMSVLGRPVTWAEATAHRRAFVAGMEMVRAMGHALLPKAIGMLASLPGVLLTATLWMFSRTKFSRDLGVLGPTEARMLVDMMHAAQPQRSAPLRAVRP